MGTFALVLPAGPTPAGITAEPTFDRGFGTLGRQPVVDQSGGPAAGPPVRPAGNFREIHRRRRSVRDPLGRPPQTGIGHHSVPAVARVATVAAVEGIFP